MSGSETGREFGPVFALERSTLPSWERDFSPRAVVFTALVIGALVILWAGGNPIAAYIGLFQGGFGSLRALSETAVWWYPDIFAGLAVALALKGGCSTSAQKVSWLWAPRQLPGLVMPCQTF